MRTRLSDAVRTTTTSRRVLVVDGRKEPPMTRRVLPLLLVPVVSAAMTTVAAAAPPAPEDPEVTSVTTEVVQGSGSAIGPDGALYVTEGPTGRVLRVDRGSGQVSTYASGLPLPIFPIGGAADVTFLDDTAYVLVTMVGADLGGSDTVGIYRIDSPTTSTVVADIGTFSSANPPATDFFIPTGVHYSIEAFRGGFLVTDGHHNRVLQVSLDGEVTEVVTLGNVVPTGTEVRGNTVYFTLAGPVPHVPKQGRVMATDGKWSAPTEIASGAPLAVDVELGRGRTMYALAQGDWQAGGNDGDPALPDTGELLRVNDDGSMTVVVDGLDQPTSMEVVGTSAWVVSLDGEITRVDNLAGAPFGR
jgi:sugar lactone lactonase YvrE